MVTVSLINDELFDIISTWWSKHKSKMMPREFLPQNGIMISVDERPACSAWFYKTDSGVGILGFVCANPDASKEDRHKSLEYLAKNAISFAKTFGISLLYCPLRSQGLQKRLKRNGWESLDDGHWIWS